MTELSKLSRRGFLQASAVATGGLVIGWHLPLSAQSQKKDGVFNPFVKITPDNRVVVISKHLDKGQGSTTGLATIVAEELDADWSQMETEFAPADVTKYANGSFGVQGTGGSTAMNNSWMQYRQAGAAARAMLVSAAAAKWGVDPKDISVSKGVVTSGKRQHSFGELADAAAALRRRGRLKRCSGICQFAKAMLPFPGRDDPLADRNVFWV
ncbi:MAG: molybdopterin cofactor-binding domain-containing protein, partial [Pseudomonadota bacterium]